MPAFARVPITPRPVLNPPSAATAPVPRCRTDAAHRADVKQLAWHGQSCRRDALLRRTDFRALRGVAVQAADAGARLRRSQPQGPVQGRRRADHARPREPDLAIPRRSRARPICCSSMPTSASSRNRSLRLHQCGADMCAAVYPIKRIDWDKVQTDDREPRGPIRRRRRCNTSLKSTIRTPSSSKAGFVKVRYAGTGFLMIRREALERMCAHYPQLRNTSAITRSMPRPRATTASRCSNA